MGKFRIAAALFLLLAGELVLARPGGAAPERRVSARQLLQTVDSALAGTAQAAGSPRGGLDPRDPRSSPFWSALNGMRLRVAEIAVALDRRDGELFTLLDQGSSDLGALRVAWAWSGVQNEKAGEGLRIASASYRILRANYGREGVRLRQGGNLSDGERRHFQRVQRAQRRFAESLRPLREGSQRRGDRVTTAELDRFQGEAERIAWARLDLESYLNALIASGEIRGEWEADAPYIRPDAPEDFVVANEMVEDLYAESDIGHVFTVDLGTAGALSHLDQETVLPEPEPGAVQVFQAGSEVEAEPADAAPVLEESLDEAEPAEDVETATAEGEIVEEELPEEAPAVADGAPAVPAPGEGAVKPEAAPKDAGNSAPAGTQPADPAAISHPVPPPIG